MAGSTTEVRWTLRWYEQGSWRVREVFGGEEAARQLKALEPIDPEAYAEAEAEPEGST